ncbi:MAG: exodeoxyribonuclease VII large subunit [Patescibacteria group bacterium]
MSLLSRLREWRNNQARIEGVEVFRVFPNAVLDAIVGTLPRTKEEMLAIKGIKEAKYGKYGAAILRIIAESAPSGSDNQMASGAKISVSSNLEALLPNVSDEGKKEEDQTLSVSQFLDGLNVELSGMASRVQGEVSSVDVRERVIYFTIKDVKDESTLNCLIFRYQYDISGVEIAIGDEIIVEGVPEIYKPSGRLSMKIGVIELAGIGALQKAYEALKLKFEQEGLFAPARKRALPEFPETIALITSEQGAAIGDFTMNLGAQGLNVHFYPVSVEGKKAVFEIIKAIRYFNRSPEKYDVLVIVRGGGSLESLQAFNNEALSREVAGSNIPTLCGIGHEKDVTLAAMVADVMVSTPTATARTLRAPWDAARSTLAHTEKHLLQIYERTLLAAKHQVETFSHTLISRLDQFSKRFQALRERFSQHIPRMQFQIREARQSVIHYSDELKKQYQQVLEEAEGRIEEIGETLKRYDPKRALALGYSLIQKEGRILRSVEGVKKGDSLTLRLAKGRLDSEVTGVYND